MVNELTDVLTENQPPEREELAAQLPPLYARWLDAILASPIPAERHATCQDCAMCASTQTGTTCSERVFKPDVKCCSFYPTLPNFLVGSILADDSLRQSVATIDARISAGVGATPLGLSMPDDYRLLYDHNRSTLFGRSKAMRCPHFIEDGGQCGIYRHRNAVCSTFHCKYVRGAIGQRFWKRLLTLLTAVEYGLSTWCLDLLGIEPEVIARLLDRRKAKKDSQAIISAEELDRDVSDQYRRTSWGSRWLGRERDFYVASSNAVQRLSWSDVRNICGIDVKLAASLVQHAYTALLQRQLPDHLRFVGVMRPHNEMLMRLTGYSDDDQLVVPRHLAELLTLFDGSRSTDEVQARLAAGGVRGIGPDYLRTLVDFQILIPG
jgi:Fe-S-cluster containining protein